MNEKLKDKLDSAIANYDRGALQHFLDSYELKNGRRLSFTSGYNRTVMTAIVEYIYGENAEVYRLLKKLDVYCQQRNDYIHQLKGISKLESEEIISNMRQIIKALKINMKLHPFKEIDHKIEELLDVQ
jgi:hypothetical protein